MAMRFFNTLGRRLADLEPIRKGEVRMYTCGPTVYNVAHIGNLRTFVFEDVLRRHFRSSGLQVTQIMNITEHRRQDDQRSREGGPVSRGFHRALHGAVLPGSFALERREGREVSE